MNTRKEIAERLKSIRVEKKLKKKYFKDTEYLLNGEIYRIEETETNYNVRKLIAYVNALGCSIILKSRLQLIEINDYKNLIRYLIILRKNKGYTYYMIAKKTEQNPQMIKKAEDMQINMSINMLLKLIDEYDHQLEIVEKTDSFL